LPTKDSSRRAARDRPPGAKGVVLGFLALLALVVGLLWALSPSGPPRGVVEAPRGAVAGRSNWVVGDRVCQECHLIEAGRHRRSGHARTLRPAAETELARWLDGRGVADPERPGVDWTYRLRDGRFTADRAEAGRVERAVLEFALGSGRHATTFVTLTPSASGSPGSREHRLTYFARDRALGLTPGQEASGGAPGLNPMGTDRDPGQTLHCFGCHVTTVSAQGPRVLDSAAMRPGIGCERCHGPGGAHAEAARRGAENLSMPFGKVWTADGQMQLCGDCHRHPSQAPPGEIRADNPRIARFQPVGLMQSACYSRSDGALSCVNCHDPHAPASTDRASYEAACLACHKPGGNPVCPTSPRRGCIDCHMPALDTGQGILFTDHWIRVRKGESGGKPRQAEVGSPVSRATKLN
jgi:hypothetical protein